MTNWDPVAADMASAMIEAHHALGQERYDAIVAVLAPLAEKDDQGNFTFEAMIALTNALSACTAVANVHSRA